LGSPLFFFKKVKF